MARIFNRLRVNPKDRNSTTDSKVKQFYHSPIETTHQDVEIEVKENGHVTLSRLVGKDEVTNEDIYDAITVPASVIYKATDLLAVSRKVKFVNKSDLPRRVKSEEDKSNE